MGSVEVTLPVQDFRDDTFRAKNWDQVFLAETIGVHQRAKDFYRRSVRNGMMLFFVCFDQGHQDFGILLFFARWIVFACQFVQHGQVLLMLALRCDSRWLANFQRVFFGYRNHDFCHSFSSYST
jgi:hypothetical protein